jgi:hypothetical protein
MKECHNIIHTTAVFSKDVTQSVMNMKHVMVSIMKWEIHQLSYTVRGITQTVLIGEHLRGFYSPGSKQPVVREQSLPCFKIGMPTAFLQIAGMELYVHIKLYMDRKKLLICRLKARKHMVMDTMKARGCVAVVF